MHKIHQNTFGAELMRSSRPNSRNGGLLLRKGGSRRGKKGFLFIRRGRERERREERGNGKEGGGNSPKSR